MNSRVEALVRSFLRSDGDALYLVPGEKIFMMKGAAKAVVGREALSPDSFASVSRELVPGRDAAELAAERFRLGFRPDPDSEEVDVRYGFFQGLAALMVCRLTSRPIAVPPPAHVSPAAAAAEAAARATPTVAAPRPAPAPVPAPPVEPLPLPAPGPGPAPFPTPSRSAAPLPAPAAPPASVSGLPRGAARPAAPVAPPPDAIDVGPEGLGAKPGSFDGDASLNRSLRVPTGRPLDDILTKMISMKASDLHLSSGVQPIFRVHGEITPQEDMPVLYSDEVEKLVMGIMSERHRKEYAERNDTDFAYEIEGLARFRVNVFRDRHGVGAVFRQIPIDFLTAEQLKLPPAVVRLGDLSKGLVLVTGPTGSGKSTTLAAIVDYVNKSRTDHIITIEDPVEFVHQNKKCLINQREVGTHTRSFKDALRAALREDPDVVLVGEMRDLETIAIAIETAETGHLVFGTLHTTTATSTVDRIVDQFPADRQQQIRVMLADSLKGVIAQTLCKKVGGGRVAALEILLTNNAVANLIRDGKTFQLPSVLQTSKTQGMVLLNDSLLELVKRGEVEPREAYIKAVDKTGLLAAFRNNNISLPTDAVEPAGGSPPPGGAAGGAQAPGTPQAGPPAVSSPRGGKPS